MRLRTLRKVAKNGGRGKSALWRIIDRARESLKTARSQCKAIARRLAEKAQLKAKAKGKVKVRVDLESDEEEPLPQPELEEQGKSA